MFKVEADHDAVNRLGKALFEFIPRRFAINSANSSISGTGISRSQMAFSYGNNASISVTTFKERVGGSSESLASATGVIPPLRIVFG